MCKPAAGKYEEYETSRQKEYSYDSMEKTMYYVEVAMALNLSSVRASFGPHVVHVNATPGVLPWQGCPGPQRCDAKINTRHIVAQNL